MKKSFIAKLSVLLASIMLICVSLTGCGGLFGGDNSDPTPKEYTIQYSDDAGTHTLTVTEGMPYSLESVPYKYGYEFLGLYDAQTGGTQYVGANGASLAPYKDQENKVLFPQFKPIDYTVILDYGNANVTGERSLTVAYNESIPELPKNLTLAHNEFTGWYTEADGKGTQVADPYGNLPIVSVLNEENFKLDESKRVYLYAGFELETYTVTFIFDNDMPSEEVEVPYNTPISQVVPKTRNDKKEAGLTWSKSKGGEVFNGNITDNIVLYVQEWAPVIELNGNGVDVMPIVAKAGTTISLPAPTKPLAKFLRWEDENGEEYKATKMPDKSITLNAIWQGKIEFDENGGTDVDDISKPAGENLSLPMPTKEGYLFAGWYMTDKEKYTQSKMPSEGIALKAGWYKEKLDTVVVVKASDVNSSGDLNTAIQPRIDRLCYALNYGKYSSEGKEINVTLDFHVKLWTSSAGGSSSLTSTVYLDLYREKQISSVYLIKTLSFDNVHNAFNSDNGKKSFDISTSILLNSDVYMCWYKNTDKELLYLSDFYYTVHYPDISNLYL